jgi:20S proteasome alpha/beta subunit
LTPICNPRPHLISCTIRLPAFQRAGDAHSPNMTIVVTAKVSDGIVLAAGSFFGAGTTPIKIYNNANKIFNLRKVWPIGALVYGTAGIGASSVETLSKDLRTRFSDDSDKAYGLDPTGYTIEEVAQKARRFLFEEAYHAAYPVPPAGFGMGYRVCGYSAGASLPEVWEFIIFGAQCDPPIQVQGQDEWGLRWAGENEALDRLLLGSSSQLVSFLQQNGFDQAGATAAHLDFVKQAGAGLIIPAMPIQDAIDVSRFLVETATKFARYGLRPETVGGPTEVAVITKHEGFKWIARKHYYPAELNRETNHGR